MEMILKTTSDIKTYLGTLYPNLPVKNWKRVRKFINSWVYRTYQNGDFVVLVNIRPDGSGAEVTIQGFITKADEPIVEALITAAKTLVIGSDYGELYYHPARKRVCYVGGDGDFCDNQPPMTDSDTAIKILSVSGVSKVILECETQPDGYKDADECDGGGWCFLGWYGTQHTFEE